MTTATIHQSDRNPTGNRIASDLPALAAQIARETRLVHSAPLDTDISDDWERVWELRAKAARTRALSLGDLQSKAAIIADELRRDETALDSDAPGLALNLIESLVHDLLMLRLEA